MSDKPRRSVTLDEEITEAIPEQENFSEKVREWARLEYVEDKDLVVETETIQYVKTLVQEAKVETRSDLETVIERSDQRHDAIIEQLDEMLSEQQASQEPAEPAEEPDVTVEHVAEQIGLAPYGPTRHINDRVRKSVRTVWADKADRDPDELLDDLNTFLSQSEGGVEV